MITTKSYYNTQFDHTVDFNCVTNPVLPKKGDGSKNSDGFHFCSQNLEKQLKTEEWTFLNNFGFKLFFNEKRWSFFLFGLLANTTHHTTPHKKWGRFSVAPLFDFSMVWGVDIYFELLRTYVPNFETKLYSKQWLPRSSSHHAYIMVHAWCMHGACMVTTYVAIYNNAINIRIQY